MEFYARTFDRLTTVELHDAYALRAAVFVAGVEIVPTSRGARDLPTMGGDVTEGELGGVALRWVGLSKSAP